MSKKKPKKKPGFTLTDWDNGPMLSPAAVVQQYQNLRTTPTQAYGSYRTAFMVPSSADPYSYPLDPFMNAYVAAAAAMGVRTQCSRCGGATLDERLCPLECIAPDAGP